MTIYFDKNKNAFAFEIKDYIAKTDDQTWHRYSDTDKWDIINGEFTDISNTEDYKNKKVLEHNLEKIKEIKNKLNEIDLKSIRPARAGETDRLAELEAQASDLRSELSELQKTIE